MRSSQLEVEVICADMESVRGLDLDIPLLLLLLVVRKKGTPAAAARPAAVKVLVEEEQEGDTRNPFAADTRRAGAANLKARRIFIEFGEYTIQRYYDTISVCNDR